MAQKSGLKPFLTVLQENFLFCMKVSIIGAGNVGATTALVLMQRNIADIVLIDIVEGLAEGKALDIAEASSLGGFRHSIAGSTDFSKIAESDIVVITSGVARKPGMTREELFAINKKIVESVCESIKKFAPKAIVIMVTNPLDLMCMVAFKALGFPMERVIGMAGVLDSARMDYFASEKAGILPEKVESLVLGSHGDTMVSALSQSTVAGKRLESALPKEELEKIIERTKNGGAEIVGLLKTGSAFVAPAYSVAEIVEAIAKDSKKVLPCSALAIGEYGIEGIFIGLPCMLGKNGLEKIVELELAEAEKSRLLASSEQIKKILGENGLI
jgi:malate dehydrogenase